MLLLKSTDASYVRCLSLVRSRTVTSACGRERKLREGQVDGTLLRAAYDPQRNLAHWSAYISRVACPR